MIRLLAVDGNSLAYPAFAASGDCKGSFLGRLIGWRREYSPGILAVAWDRSDSRDLRTAIDPAYKADREPAPAEYYEQIAGLRELLPPLGIVQYDGPGEGDDVLATLARTMPGPLVIATGDKDLLQLIRPGISVLKFWRGEEELLDHDSCQASTGLTPDGWLARLCLAGDPVDGVPGLRGVGKWRADGLIAACPDIVEWILDDDRADDVRAAVAAADVALIKYAELAIAERDTLALTRRLVSLYTIELDVTPAALDLSRAATLLAIHGLSWVSEEL